MKSTTSLRPAMPPPPALLLMYFAAPFTPSTTPLNRPGANALSTSAITAMWIWVGVTPTSVAFGAAPDCAAAGGMATAANPARHSPTSRTRPLRTIRVLSLHPAAPRERILLHASPAVVAPPGAA